MCMYELLHFFNFRHAFMVDINAYCNGFAQIVSRQRLGKHGQHATMEYVSQWTNVILRC
jgi:hypothetical protein